MAGVDTILPMADMTDKTDDRAAPDVESLVAKLRARVEERRRQGSYPPGLEDDLAQHFQRVLNQRIETPHQEDLHGPLEAVRLAQPLSSARIRLDSALPAGQVFHRTIAKVVGRQTQGALQQVQAFAAPTTELLERIVATLEGLSRDVHVELARHLDAIYERQAAHERTLAGLGLGAAGSSAAPAEFHPWYSAERFEQEFGRDPERCLEAYHDLADRFASAAAAPVLDIGCGRGTLLGLLAEHDVEAWGVDLDAELVKLARGQGLRVDQADGLSALGCLESAALGGLALIHVLDSLTPQRTVDLVALAADKVRPRGLVCVETANPQSLYGVAHRCGIEPARRQPVHPAYLAFLFREAGFSEVDIEWRSPVADDERLQTMDGDPENGVVNTNVRRLNELLFAPQDYLLVARR